LVIPQIGLFHTAESSAAEFRTDVPQPRSAFRIGPPHSDLDLPILPE